MTAKARPLPFRIAEPSELAQLDAARQPQEDDTSDSPAAIAPQNRGGTHHLFTRANAMRRERARLLAANPHCMFCRAALVEEGGHPRQPFIRDAKLICATCRGGNPYSKPADAAGGKEGRPDSRTDSAASLSSRRRPGWSFVNGEWQWTNPNAESARRNRHRQERRRLFSANPDCRLCGARMNETPGHPRQAHLYLGVLHCETCRVAGRYREIAEAARVKAESESEAVDAESTDAALP